MQFQFSLKKNFFINANEDIRFLIKYKIETSAPERIKNNTNLLKKDKLSITKNKTGRQTIE